MPRPFDDDGGYYDSRPGSGQDGGRADREISLGTPTILGIFFGLALVCACFFGFGYTMGHNSARAADAAGSAVIDPATGLAAGAAKPAAGSLAPHSATPPDASPQPSDGAASTQADSQNQTVPLTPPTAPKAIVLPSDRIIAGDKPALPARPQPAAPSPQLGSNVGTYVVQVAAVSTQDLADIEVAALKKQGFEVAVRHEPQDKLLHVQIGPFPDRKAAEAMQKRVIADGFNAIVK